MWLLAVSWLICFVFWVCSSDGMLARLRVGFVWTFVVMRLFNLSFRRFPQTGQVFFVYVSVDVDARLHVFLSMVMRDCMLFVQFAFEMFECDAHCS